MKCSSSDSAAAPFSGWSAAAVETASDMRSWRTSASAPRTLALCSLEVIVERDRRLAAHRGAERAGADDAGELAGAGAADDLQRAGRLLAVERAGAAEDDRAGALADLAVHPEVAGEVGGLVRAVGHQPVRSAGAGDAAGERLRDLGARQAALIRLVPGIDLERARCLRAHGDPSDRSKDMCESLNGLSAVSERQTPDRAARRRRSPPRAARTPAA